MKEKKSTEKIVKGKEGGNEKREKNHIWETLLRIKRSENKGSQGMETFI